MNRPFVTIEDFAAISCMDGFAVGVRTGSCDTCDYMMNPCLRRNMRDALVANQHRAERILGHDLIAKYHSAEIVWNGRTGRLNIPDRGVAAINVKQVITPVPDGPFTLTYKIANNLSLTVVGQRFIVTIPDTFLENPDHAIVRDHVSGSVVLKVDSSAYPRKVGSNWEIEVDQSNPVDVFHCRFAFLTMDTPTCLNGEVVAVYPGTEDFIPYALPPVDNLDDTTTYTFFLWSLVKKSFWADEEINLEAGQYYKLLSEMEFLCLTETTALPFVMGGPDCSGDFVDEEQPTTALKLTMLHDGVVEVFARNPFICRTRRPIKIKIFYKTDPALLKNFDAFPFKEAIVYLTAAELTMKVCNCPPPTYGFIFQAQAHYGTLKINPFNGNESWQLSYGDKYGEIKFSQILGKSKKIRETLKL